MMAEMNCQSWRARRAWRVERLLGTWWLDVWMQAGRLMFLFSVSCFSFCCSAVRKEYFHIIHHLRPCAKQNLQLAQVENRSQGVIQSHDYNEILLGKKIEGQVMFDGRMTTVWSFHWERGYLRGMGCDSGWDWKKRRQMKINVKIEKEIETERLCIERKRWFGR